ncbi:MAG: dihydroorotate dehydrogenase electron transfer subunit [Armatimonadetes bacterium]|nr:dihydroorotate dehydrogenase electron transfer subunit [Armatimonadota bacterium]NIM23413.1 dihydroorotate dehydrogenase electron transfer subunit [Armatimonadota bacterium]NIM67278.1 dihydroorotate dehydrogenase electron transfer subunit [Armatimonadota bacterium]NIM75776.1 dihydroorotate dehydrogenase electron transfer subunit [Armatimonadota bacterium]NIN05464.1 dihydroorotate dehydrogenase electron transfer subunit [Armatimonadota bacterium]
MNQIRHIMAKVLESGPAKERCSTCHRLVLHAPDIASRARPGQFVHCVPGFMKEDIPLLRRPLSISGVSANSPSTTPDNLEFILRLMGTGTRLLARHKPGQLIDCLGPLGNGFTLVEDKTALLIAGGMGVAPLRWLAMELAAKGGRVYLLAGAKSNEEFPCKVELQDGRARIPELEAVGVDTEFVSEEDGLLATDLLKRRLPELAATGRPIQAYAVGPRAMLKALAAIMPKDVSCEVSLEERMACGVGACRSCVVALRHPDPPGYVYRRVCKDGPVFDLFDIVWAKESDID